VIRVSLVGLQALTYVALAGLLVAPQIGADLLKVYSDNGPPPFDA
jgi:hypothetical protein